MNKCCLFLASLVLSVSAFAVEENAEMRPCRDDMQKFCTDVKQGEGRQMKCMYDLRDRLSPGCAALVTQKYERFEQLRKAKEGGR